MILDGIFPQAGILRKAMVTNYTMDSIDQAAAQMIPDVSVFTG